MELLEVEGFQLKEILRCLLHTIVFHRSLGSIFPKEVDCDVFDVSYARVDDKGLERVVERRIDSIYQSIVEMRTTRFTVTLRFYIYSEAKGFMLNQREKMFWEQWMIPITISTQKKKGSERDHRHNQRQQALRDRLLYIIQMMNNKTKHVPPVKKNVPCFPFDIVFSDGTKPNTEKWSFGKMFSQYISQGLSKREG